MNDPRKKALMLLEHRDKTEYEIIMALRKSGFSLEDIDNTIDYLKEMGYIDDTAYAFNYVEMSKRKRRGYYRIHRELLSKGISKDIIENTLTTLLDDDWEINTAELIAADIREKNISMEKKKLLSKTINKLKYNGFSDNTISKVVDDLNNKL